MTHKISMPEDFVREFQDDDSVIKDVRLIGSDGGSVSASKSLLAIRSPVFRRMFYGDFHESSNECDSVELNYPTLVLREVVSYCYTNLTEFNLHDQKLLDSDSAAVALVQLRDAANCLALSKLRDDISDLFEVNQKEIWFSVCAILQELMIRGDTNGELWKACAENIHETGESLFPWEHDCNTAAGIRDTPFNLLEIILGYLGDLEDGEHTCNAAKALQSWNATHDSATEEERSKLQNFADGLDLKRLSISNLIEIYPDSLFPLERLLPILEIELTLNTPNAYMVVKTLKVWNEAHNSATEESFESQQWYNI